MSHPAASVRAEAWSQPSVIGAGRNPPRDSDRQSWPSRLRLYTCGSISPESLSHSCLHSATHCHFQEASGSQREELQLPQWKPGPSSDLAFFRAVHFLLLFSSFSLGSWAAGKEWILLNDKIMNVILRQEWEGGRRCGELETRGGKGRGKTGKGGGEYITELANVPSCQGVNLSEALQCDIIYSEIPNLSALIFQPQHCLSQCARDDWSIYKTATANLLNIYVQCHVQESSRIYSSVLCSYAHAGTCGKSFTFTENVRNE